MKNIFIIITLGLAIAGCKPKQATKEKHSNTETENTQTVAKIQSITINEMVDMTNTGDPYTIENAQISGDTLILQLSYGGGCEEHQFELLNNFAFKEHIDDFKNLMSYQTRITLKHNANNDKCRSIVRSEERFDLTKIRQIDSREIRMQLSGWENELIYTYPVQKH